MIKLALASLRNRYFTTSLTIFSIAISVALFLGVEKIRVSARDSFANTISQTDLIVGARTGSTQLLLYSVFHMGDATNNISYKTYLNFKNNPKVEWAIPLSLGDSHKGYRVVATDNNFYQHYHFQTDQEITFAAGVPADGIFDVVLGSEVANKLGYKLKDKIALTHGVSEGFGMDHSNKPFQVVGILSRTNTPIDRSLYITLEGMEAIHIDWKSGAPPMLGMATPADKITKANIKIGQITAFLLRTNSRVQSIYLQRDINTYEDEALLAIIPGVALSELWRTIGYAEDGLRLISLFVVLSGFLGMLTTLYISMNERRREMAILRAIGASPGKIFSLLVFESVFLTFLGALLGTICVYLGMFLARPLVENEFGIHLTITAPSIDEMIFLVAVLLVSFFIGAIPAWRGYKNALADGLSIKT